MIKRIVFGLYAACVFCLAGCVPAAQNATNSSGEVFRPYTLPPSDVEVVKRDVASSLKDPQSAVFGEMAASISSRGVVQVCGMVNARNSFGGYTGHKPFLGVLATNTSGQRVFGVSAVGGTDTESLAVLMVCKRNGIG